MTDDTIERRRGNGDIQRDLGRMESDIKSIGKTVTDNAAIAQRERDIMQRSVTDLAVQVRADHDATTSKIDAAQAAVVEKIDALMLVQAEQKGGWKMLGLVGLGGGTIGGGVATLLGLFGGK